MKKNTELIMLTVLLTVLIPIAAFKYKRKHSMQVVPVEVLSKGKADTLSVKDKQYLFFRHQCNWKDCEFVGLDPIIEMGRIKLYEEFVTDTDLLNITHLMRPDLPPDVCEEYIWSSEFHEVVPSP